MELGLGHVATVGTRNGTIPSQLHGREQRKGVWRLKENQGEPQKKGKWVLER